MKRRITDTGNINTKKTAFRDTWPNGRPYKHGAMEFFFHFKPHTRLMAEEQIVEFMKDKGYERGVDYHIPGWNYPSYDNGIEFWKDSIIITFNDDETFVMAKLSWGLETDES